LSEAFESRGVRRAVVTALVSVALVTAAGTFGALAVGDAGGGANGTNKVVENPGPGHSSDAAESDGRSDEDGDGPSRDLWVLLPATGNDSESNASERQGATDGDNATGVAGADADRDGLTNGAEADLDTDPMRPDTDGDNVTDGRELELGTDPTVADTDGDGLADGYELELGTDPTAADTDDDGLADGRELGVGTDPLVADTDGDGLLDGWERHEETPAGVALPGADPLAKDLYVQVDYARGTDRPSEGFYSTVAAEFAEMPVDNPDGSSGVSVHVRDGGRVNASVSFTGETGSFWTLKDRYYRSELGPRAGVYHQVLVADFEGDEVGYGEVGGEFSVLAADLDSGTRRRVVVHELLHNVVGRVEARGVCPDEPRHYCGGGYLGPRIVTGDDAYLAEALARQIERDGFSD
jgi:hypothetical protein